MDPTPGGYIFARLSFSSSEVKLAILAHPWIQDEVARLERLGHCPIPWWANGAIVLAPCTGPVKELVDLELEPEHIIFHPRLTSAIGVALMNVPEKNRPLVSITDEDWAFISSREWPTSATQLEGRADMNAPAGDSPPCSCPP